MCNWSASTSTGRPAPDIGTGRTVLAMRSIGAMRGAVCVLVISDNYFLPVPVASPENVTELFAASN